MRLLPVVVVHAGDEGWDEAATRLVLVHAHASAATGRQGVIKGMSKAI